VTQRLRYHIQDGAKVDPKEFQICCISFAKGIDFAIANNDIPKKVEEFPWLLKQVISQLKYGFFFFFWINGGHC
jgi:E3 SUMO-protein ligase PIAS1